MSEILGGVKATYDYIKHGIDTYNRQQRLRELKDKGGIEAIKQAIQAGEFSGGAKKGLVMEEKKKKKKTVKKSPTVPPKVPMAKRRGRPFGSYQPKPAIAQSAISRAIPYYNLGTISQQPLPQQLSNPLIQRSGMAVMSQQQYDPSYAYQIQQTLKSIQEQKGEIGKIKEAQQEIAKTQRNIQQMATVKGSTMRGIFPIEEEMPILERAEDFPVSSQIMPQPGVKKKGLIPFRGVMLKKSQIDQVLEVEKENPNTRFTQEGWVNKEEPEEP